MEFGNEADVGAALEYHKRTIGTRYVEVFKCPRAEMDRVVNPATAGSGVCKTPLIARNITTYNMYTTNSYLGAGGC